MGFEESVRGRWKSLQVDETPEIEETEAETPAATATEGTFIGTGALFEGTLNLKGDFCIDSEFHGSLATDGVLTVGPAGSVEGDIQAREVIRMRNRLNEILAGATGRTVDQVAKDADRDFIMTAEQAREYGIIDQVMEKRG